MYNNFFNSRATNFQEKGNDFFNVLTDIMGEFDAIRGYDLHAKESNKMEVKQTLTSIKQEEMVHAGELLALLFTLEPEMEKFIKQGMQEFNERRLKN